MEISGKVMFTYSMKECVCILCSEIIDIVFVLSNSFYLRSVYTDERSPYKH